MPCHPKLEKSLDAYIKAAGIEGDRKGPLFRFAIGKTGQLSGRAALRSRSRADVRIGRAGDHSEQIAAQQSGCEDSHMARKSRLERRLCSQDWLPHNSRGRQAGAWTYARGRRT
jgi:hypothetical protein